MSNSRKNIEIENLKNRDRIWYRVDSLPEYIVHEDDPKTYKQTYATKRVVYQELIRLITTSNKPAHKTIQIIKLQHFTLMKEEDLINLLEFKIVPLNTASDERDMNASQKPEILLEAPGKMNKRVNKKMNKHMILNYLSEELVQELINDINLYKPLKAENVIFVNEIKNSEAFKNKTQASHSETFTTTSITTLASEIPDLPQEFFDDAQSHTALSGEINGKQILNSDNPSAVNNTLSYLRNEFERLDSMQINTFSQLADLRTNAIEIVDLSAKPQTALNPIENNVQQSLSPFSLFAKLQNALEGPLKECVNSYTNKVVHKLEDIELRLKETEIKVQNFLKRNENDSVSERPLKMQRNK